MLPPFNVMPRSALTAAGDAVMGQLMRTLLPLFMHKCATHTFCVSNAGQQYCALQTGTAFYTNKPCRSISC